jgi:hypothetical protein
MSQSRGIRRPRQRHLPWLIDFRPEKAVELFFQKVVTLQWPINA